MLKRSITYEDFDGNEITEDFYFNISQPELIELEVEVKEGMAEWLQKIIKAEDRKELVAQFKRLVLMAYGEKSEDGKRFIKTDESRLEFSQSAAYNTLFMELATDDKAAAYFVNNILPKNMQAEIAKAQQAEQTPSVSS